MATLSVLTPRETEILQLVLTGQTNKTIAAKIFVCEKTVEFHLAHIYTKVGVRTRLLAGIWAMQQGIRAETGEIPSQFELYFITIIFPLGIDRIKVYYCQAFYEPFATTEANSNDGTCQNSLGWPFLRANEGCYFERRTLW